MRKNNYFLLFIFSSIIIFSCSKEKTIQERLDSGETPFEILESGIHKSSIYGSTFQGGLIFHIDELTGTGLVASVTNLPSTKWGCNQVPILNVIGFDGNVEGILSTSIGAGPTNTSNILSSGCGPDSAAELCDQYTGGDFTDWFLPSLIELNRMEVLGFKGEFWSSTPGPENDEDKTAWSRILNNITLCEGGVDWLGLMYTICQTTNSRNKSLKVRAVRSF